MPSKWMADEGIDTIRQCAFVAFRLVRFSYELIRLERYCFRAPTKKEALSEIKSLGVPPLATKRLLP